MTARPTQGGSSGTWGTELNAWLDANVVTAFNVKGYGADPTGATDSTDAIEEALVAGAGADVIFPPGSYQISRSLAPARGTRLLGTSAFKVSDVPTPTCRIVASTGLTVPLISSAVAEVTVKGIAFQGSGAVSGSKGIVATVSGGWLIRDCFFNNFGDQAVQMSGGNDTVLDNLWAENCVLIRTGRVDYVGGIQVSGSDFMLSHIRSTTSSAGNTTGSGWISGIVIDGENCFVTNCMGHLSESGIVVTGNAASSGVRMVACRSDLNYADGFVVAGFRSDFIGCLSYRDGQATNNTYDGFKITGGLNHFVGCRTLGVGADANKPRDGFRDTASTANPNSYTDCRASDINGKVITRTMPTVVSATTIAVPDGVDLVTVSGTTTITSVTAGYSGQRVTLLFSGALTFTDGSNLKLAGNFVTTADDTISLVCDGTNWIETSRAVN